MPVQTPRFPGATRVVVADDSAFMRRILTSALEQAGFDVVGAAKDGDEALALCERLQPDAMTLDLAMPGLDGMGVLRALRKPGATDVPVVVVSAFSPAHGARAVDALAEGAFELVGKPATGEPLTTFTSELREKVRNAADTHKGRNGRRSSPSGARRPADAAPRASGAPVARRGPSAVRSATKRLVVIACSTGGPKALAELVPMLPARVGSGVLIVQHMPPGFTGSLAQRLDRSSQLTVKEATGGELLEPDVALLAPGGSHLRLDKARSPRLSDEPAIGGLRPRADLTIKDAARLYGRRLVLVVLTGMGQDGLEGAHDVRREGGRILAEAESTCTVYGMPRAIVEAGLADAVMPLNELAAAIAAEAG